MGRLAQVPHGGRPGFRWHFVGGLHLHATHRWQTAGCPRQEEEKGENEHEGVGQVFVE